MKHLWIFELETIECHRILALAQMNPVEQQVLIMFLQVSSDSGLSWGSRKVLNGPRYHPTLHSMMIKCCTREVHTKPCLIHVHTCVFVCIFSWKSARVEDIVS